MQRLAGGLQFIEGRTAGHGDDDSDDERHPLLRLRPGTGSAHTELDHENARLQQGSREQRQTLTPAPVTSAPRPLQGRRKLEHKRAQKLQMAEQQSISSSTSSSSSILQASSSSTDAAGGLGT